MLNGDCLDIGEGRDGVKRKSLPSFVIYRSGDCDIRAAAMRFTAETTHSRKTVAIEDRSHSLIAPHSALTKTNGPLAISHFTASGPLSAHLIPGAIVLSGAVHRTEKTRCASLSGFTQAPSGYRRAALYPPRRVRSDRVRTGPA